MSTPTPYTPTAPLRNPQLRASSLPELFKDINASPDENLVVISAEAEDGTKLTGRFQWYVQGEPVPFETDDYSNRFILPNSNGECCGGKCESEES